MPQKIQRKYTMEQCMDLMKSCGNSYEFFKRYRMAYHSIPKDILFKHFDIRNEIIQEMRKYDTTIKYAYGIQ